MDNNNKPKQPVDALGEQIVTDNAIAGINKKLIIWCLVGILAVIAVGGIIYWIQAAGAANAQEAIGRADIEQNDSTRFALYKKIADDGSYKANDRAKLMTAIKYYNDGKYAEALKYLDGVKVGSDVIQTGVYSLQGDCYANLNKLDEARKAFDRALDEADGNPSLVPFILVKEANVCRAQKDYETEADLYRALRQDYPGFMMDVDKYYQRALASSAK